MERRPKSATERSSDGPVGGPALAEVAPKGSKHRLTAVLAEPPAGSSSDDLLSAARAYRDLLHDSGPACDVDSWCEQFAGRRSCAELFRDLHRSDPELAERLAESLTRLPQPGRQVGGFRLEAELGRGAFGRVYLVRQEELADRLVVLKVAADVWSEAHILARLQHTNIMPVYSVHDLEPLSAVCMPYLGATTLEDVLKSVRGHGSLPNSGGALVQTIRDRHSATLADLPPLNVPGPTPAHPDLPGPATEDEAARGAPVMRLLRRLSYVDAILWIATRLADGLAYAHEHGVVHRDIKPANILLSDDGQPLLLDFNVAEVRLRGHVGACRAGGTVPYMSPEHLGVLQRWPDLIDARSDIFSLGIVLFELLTGRSPYPIAEGPPQDVLKKALADRLQPPPRLRPLNPAVTPAVEAIVLKCLEPDQNRRYQSARQLQEDLDRHRENLPLRHAANPSVSERVRKWCRRHPRVASSGTVAALSAVAVAVLVALVVGSAWSLAAVEERQRAVAQLRAFQDDASAVRFYLYTRATEPEQRKDGVALARQALARYGIGGDANWADAPLVRALTEPERRQLRATAGEVLLLLSRALATEAETGGGPDRLAELKKASDLAGEAEVVDPELAQTLPLWYQRAELAGLLGDDAEKDRLRGVALQQEAKSARDLYWKATDLFARGRPGEALPLLREAVRREPDNVWAWFTLANCYDRLGQDARAEGCYDTCIALAPGLAWAHFDRGLALLRQKQDAAAVAAFDEALRLKPDLTDALVNRALAYQGMALAEGKKDADSGRRDYEKAIADLTTALERGSTETRLYFLRARMKEKIGDAEGAKRDVDEGLRRQPGDEKSWIARGLARMGREPEKALDDFEQALKINPRSAAALQDKAHVLADRLGKAREALPAMEQVVAAAPESGSARSGRGVVLARLKEFDSARQDAEQALLLDSSPARQYQVACIYSLTSADDPDDRPRALQLLASALRQGYGLDLLDTDPDLDPLRKLPEFRRLSDAARALRPPGPR